MSATAPRIVIGRRVHDNGNAAYMARRRAEREERRFMCNLLVRWGRGFNLTDAPPDLRHGNGWTRYPPLWYNGRE